MKSKKKYAEKFVGITPKDYEELGDWHKKVLDIFSRSVLLKEACKAKKAPRIERVIQND